MRLTDLKIGESAIIKSFKSDKLIQKLYEMGCLPGEKISLERISVFGDPIAVRVSGYLLSLRKSEASLIEVERL
ncbi:MAG: FeoA family protein [Bacteroidota bacterium]